MATGPFPLQRGRSGTLVSGETLAVQPVLHGSRVSLLPRKRTQHFHFVLVLGEGILLTQLSTAGRGKAVHLALKIFQEIRQKILGKDRNSK